MDIKKAVAVCLISLFSATLVLLIARVLDLNAASRLEPQLVRIAEELETIRKQGGMAAGPAQSKSIDDGLVVYYFYSNTRCPTCRAIESQSHETVQSHFAEQLDRGEMVWKTLNYEEPSGAELAKPFGIQVPVVVLARMQGGQIDEWKRLDDVWALVGDKSAFIEYVRAEIGKMLETAEEKPTAAPDGDAPAIPIPNTDPPDIPVPAVPADIPVPG